MPPWPRRTARWQPQSTQIERPRFRWSLPPGAAPRQHRQRQNPGSRGYVDPRETTRHRRSKRAAPKRGERWRAHCGRGRAGARSHGDPGSHLRLRPALSKLPLLCGETVDEPRRLVDVLQRYRQWLTGFDRPISPADHFRQTIVAARTADLSPKAGDRAFQHGAGLGDPIDQPRHCGLSGPEAPQRKPRRLEEIGFGMRFGAGHADPKSVWLSVAAEGHVGGRAFTLDEAAKLIRRERRTAGAIDPCRSQVNDPADKDAGQIGDVSKKVADHAATQLRARMRHVDIDVSAARAEQVQL